ncbi:MAG: DUF302 domain-containing protein [Acidobacteriota bacterium]
MIEPLIKISKRSFDETIELIEELLEAEGFALMGSKNIEEVIRTKLGVKDFSRYTIILACKPELAKAALEASLLSGLLFPCSFTVYEDEGEVKIGHVSIMKAIPEIGLAPFQNMKPVIEETGGYIRKIWEKL